MPELPEVLNVSATGRTVRREDVDRLSDDERQKLWYERHYTTPDGIEHTAAVWPFVVDSFHFASPLAMSRAELEGLGLSDAKLVAEHVAYYAGSAPRLHGEDTPAVQEARRKTYDEVTAAWYADPPIQRRAGH